jgi:hypothetical protein
MKMILDFHNHVCCRSGFTTLLPEPLQESSPLWFFFFEWAQITQGVGYERIRWIREFTWFGLPERNTLRPQVNKFVLLYLSVWLKSSSFALDVCPNLCQSVTVRPHDPTGGPGAGRPLRSKGANV